VLAEIAALLKRFVTSLLWLSFRPCTVMRSRLGCSLPRTWKLVRESKPVPQFQRVGPVEEGLDNTPPFREDAGGLGGKKGPKSKPLMQVSSKGRGFGLLLFY
jgi:hypothetical protein